MKRNAFAAEYVAKINKLAQIYRQQIEELYRKYQQNHQFLKTTEGWVGDSACNLTETDAAPTDSSLH